MVLKKIYGDNVSTLVQHVVTAVSILVMGIFSLGLIYSQVNSNSTLVKDNQTEIKTVNTSIQALTIEQRMIIQRIDNEAEKSENFRGRTDKALDRILDKLDDRH